MLKVKGEKDFDGEAFCFTKCDLNKNPEQCFIKKNEKEFKDEEGL